MWKSKLQKRLEVLRKNSGFTLHECKVNKGINNKVASRIAREGGVTLPEEFLSFYREMDGVDISWSLEQDNEDIYGSILILSLKEALFGYNGQVKRTQYEDVFEDVLWNEFYSSKKIKELKQHRLFESIEGDSSFITFKFLNGNIQLFYVYEEEIKPLQVSFIDYLDLIIEYVGAGYIREHLMSKRWEQKVIEDKSLNFIASQQDQC